MTKEFEEIKKIMQDHERRLSKLEKAVFVKKAKPKGNQEFRGLSGGIQYLISKGSLNVPKSAKEVQEELRKEGYHYGLQSVDKLLRIDFMTKQKILTRIRESNVWKYAIRK